jgi:20S proteasome alpha/beta subunit
MNPKPLVKFTPKRLPERKAVTIIAGFRCADGIVICSDTQETSGPSKRDVPKLRYEGRRLATDTPLAVAFCGSGYGPLIDKLIDESWNNIEQLCAMDEVCAEIERTIKKLYQEYGKIYQRGQCPTAELIYGVKTAEGHKLFSANGPIVNERPEYYSSGQGYYMADFLASRMFSKYLSLQQSVILAAYVLFQTKEHVEGCGGESHIAILRDDGDCGLIDVNRIDVLTKLLESADSHLGGLLLQVADLQMADTELLNKFTSEVKMLNFHYRKKAKEEIELEEEMTASFLQYYDEKKPVFDSFGMLPLPKKENEGEQ